MLFIKRILKRNKAQKSIKRIFIESRKYDVCKRNTLMDNSNVGQFRKD